MGINSPGYINLPYTHSLRDSKCEIMLPNTWVILQVTGIPNNPMAAHRRERVVFQKQFSSVPSSFSQFFSADATFVDKTLAIEAFLRNPASHHILRPRRCGKSY
jgi:hypothetical protein